MASDGFRAPYEAYDNTTKYVRFSPREYMKPHRGEDERRPLIVQWRRLLGCCG